MIFGGDESVFKSVDQLQRGTKNPADLNEPLKAALFDGNHCFSHRRLTALMMYQTLHRDMMVMARCKMCNSDTDKFEQRNTTRNRGLGKDTSHVDSQILRASPVLKNLRISSRRLSSNSNEKYQGPEKTATGRAPRRRG